jgi:hypothetical protein
MDLLDTQPVPDPLLRQQILWPGRIGLDLAPELRHVDPKILDLLYQGRSPYLGEKLPLGEDLSGVPDQGSQQSILNWREVDVLACDRDPPMHEVHL